MDPTHIEPTRAMRWKLGALVVALVAFNLTFDLWWRPLMAHIQSLGTCASLPWLRALLITFALLFLVVAALLLKVAHEIHTSGQVPPPRALVWSRTRIRRGWYALFNAYLGYALAAGFAVAPFVAGYALEANALFCYPQSCGC